MPPLPSRWSALLALGLALAPISADGQQVINIPAQPSCRGCTIDIRRVALLGQADGPGIIESEDVYGVADSRGRYYVFGVHSPVVKVFDARGRFLARLGREGQGPGEFRGVSAMQVSAGDTVHLFDSVNLTHSIFSPSFRFVRSTRLPFPPSINVALLERNQVVAAVPIQTPDRVGLPLHLVNANSGIARSFGSTSGVYRPDVPYADRRAIAPAGRGQVWSALQNQYRVELWSTEGRKLREFRRKVDWFPPLLRSRPQGLTAPPPASLQQVRQDSQGRLWVRIIVPDRDWKRAVRPGGYHGYSITDYNHYYDTVIEVIDPREGRLLASHRFPYLVHFMGENLLGGLVMGRDDVPYYAVWQAQLLTSSPRRSR